MLWKPEYVHARAVAGDRAGILTPEGRVLLALCACGPLSRAALARESGRDRKTVRNVVRRLEDKALVVCHDGGAEITEAGRECLLCRLRMMRAAARARM